MLSAYTGEGYNGHSFLSSKNGNTKSVQFVLTTRAIELPSDGAAAADETEDAYVLRQFLDRLAELFK